VAALRDDPAKVGKKLRFWQAGHSYIFQNPEFSDVQVCQNLFSIFDELDKLERLFFGIEASSPLEVLFGEELGIPELTPTGIVATHFNVKGKPGAMGVIGPARVDYGTVIPILRYFGNLIEEVANQ
jgi:transcriptional regulator of heat shock response